MSEISMVERVARAIYEATPRNKPYSLLTRFKRDALEAEARAAIEVMRAQPITQSVMERIIRNNRAMRGGESLMSELWSAMIDAALSEQP